MIVHGILRLEAGLDSEYLIITRMDHTSIS